MARKRWSVLKSNCLGRDSTYGLREPEKPFVFAAFAEHFIPVAFYIQLVITSQENGNTHQRTNSIRKRK